MGEIEFYECQLRDDLAIGSLASEHQADETLCDFRVCYSGPGDNGMKFGIIHYFLRVSKVSRTGQPVRQVVWIQFEDVKIDHETPIASFGVKKGHRPGWIWNLFIALQVGEGIDIKFREHLLT